MLIDSHCHLDFPQLQDDFAGVLQRAEAAGIGRMLTICTHVSRFAQVQALAEAHEHIFCTVGVHPHQAEEEGEILPERLVELAAHPKVVGIGETGLDYFYDNSPRAVQQAGFRRHIQACLETDLPIILHARDADEDMAHILREDGQGRLKGVLHCFSSGRGLAEAGLELGLYVSFSGMLTFKNSAELRAIAQDIPMDRLLVETDAPYLAPVPYRGKTNEPSYVAYTAAMLAEAKGVTPEEIATQTTANFYRLFSKAAEFEAQS